MNIKFINNLKSWVAYLLFLTVNCHAMQMAHHFQYYHSARFREQLLIKNIGHLIQRFESEQQQYLKKKAEAKQVAESNSHQNVLYNNLMLIFDTFQEEGFGENKFQTQTLILAKALEERFAPICVTQHTVHLLCQLQKFPFKIAGYTVGERITHYISDRDKVFDDWLWYIHKDANLMLLVPKKYIAQHVPVTGLTYENHNIEMCGFNSKDLIKIDSEAVVDYMTINQNHINNSVSIVDGCISLLRNNPLQQWFIYLSGHGQTFTREPQTAKEYINLFNYFDKKIATLNERLKNGYLFFKTAYEEQLTFARDEKEKYEIAYKNIDNIDEQRTKILTEIKASVTGAIAGLCYNDFFKLISFFNMLNISFLHYESCYSGGFNQAVVAELLSDIKANFIVSTTGINESPSRSSLRTESYSTFFAFLKDSFVLSKSPDTRQNKQAVLPKKSLEKIVGTVTDKEYIYANQPFVYLPSKKAFCALAVDNQTKILTNKIAEIHERENKIIDYSFLDTKLIFIYPSYVGATLKMNNATSVVSPVAQTFAQIGKNNIHILKKVIYQGKASLMVPHFVLFNISYENIIFIIKEAQCFNDQNVNLSTDNHPTILKNIVVSVKKHLKEDIVDVNIVFEQDNSTWFFSTEIKNMQEEDGARNLFNIFAQGTPIEVTPEVMESFASNLFDQAKMKQLQNENLSIDAIIKELELQIN